MVVIDTHLARGSSNGGATFHDRGGPFGHTKGAKRIVAVDVTGVPVGAPVVPASTHENTTTELMLKHLARQGVTERLELVMVDRGVTASADATAFANARGPLAASPCAAAGSSRRPDSCPVGSNGWPSQAEWGSHSAASAGPATSGCCRT